MVKQNNKYSYIANFIPRDTIFMPHHGVGSYLYNKDGARKLDFTASLGVVCLGHCHPKITKAIKQQSTQLVFTTNEYYHEPITKLSTKLCKLTNMTNSFFANSGTEAIEMALKIAKRYHFKKGIERNEIISFDQCFHGRTLGSMSATIDQRYYNNEFGPLLQQCIQATFNDIQSVRNKVSSRTAAIIIEPVQGKGGIRAADKEFLEELQKLCNAQDIILIFDEIQCGLSRTGKLFYHQYTNAMPDILVVGKGLASGLPIAGCLFSEKVQIAIEQGVHGSTFANNPLCTQVANTVLDIVSQNDFLTNVIALSKKFQQLISEVQEDCNQIISKTTCIGLMIGINFHQNIDQDEIIQTMRLKGLLCIKSQTGIRFLPPLNTNLQEIKECMKILKLALLEYGSKHSTKE